MNSAKYESLIALGAPRLPKGYSYRFFIQKKKPNPDPKSKYLSLNLDIRKHYFGIPFRVEQWYFPLYQANSINGNDNRRLLEKGILKFDDIGDGFLLPHLALLAHDAWTSYSSKARVDTKLQVNKVSENVSSHLNKGLF